MAYTTFQLIVAKSKELSRNLGTYYFSQIFSGNYIGKQSSRTKPLHFNEFLFVFNCRLSFSPHGWIEFTWNPLSTLERWLAVIGIIFMFLLTELSTFYLKFVLWVSPNHWLNGVRLGFLLLWGAVGLREVFQLLDDPDYNKIGRQSWMLLCIVCTEVLICIKFGWETITKPLPRYVYKIEVYLPQTFFQQMTTVFFMSKYLIRILQK